MKPIAIFWLYIALFFSTVGHAADCGEIYVLDRNETDTALAIKRNGIVLGYLKFRVNEKGEAAIYSMHTREAYRKTGIQKALFDDMFSRIGVVTSFEAVLVDTNFYATGLRFKDEPLFIECALAVRRAPIFKLLSARGFSRVVRCDVEDGIPVLNLKVMR